MPLWRICSKKCLVKVFRFSLSSGLSAVTPDTALSLEGKGRLDYHMSQSEKREYLLTQSIRDAMLEPFGVNSLEVKFRTRSENGILIHIQESSNYTTVKVRGARADPSDDPACSGAAVVSPHNVCPFLSSLRVLTKVWQWFNTIHP